MRNFIKNAVLSLFYLWSRLKRLTKQTPEVAILLYHTVANNDWKYSVGEREFIRQLDHLASRYNVVPLADVIQYLQGKKELPDKTVALTFDDGYLDNFLNVNPLVKEKNLPVTIFLTTNLEKSVKLGNLPRLNWPQIKEMYESGLVDFQAHGHDHRNLKTISVDPTLLHHEVTTSRDLIKENLHKEVDIYAYASGHRNQLVIDHLRENGFRAAVGISEGLAKPGRHLFNIPRIQVDKTINFLLFKLRLSGAVDLNRKFIDKVRKLYGKK